jgi:hypothetical protein
MFTDCGGERRLAPVTSRTTLDRVCPFLFSIHPSAPFSSHQFACLGAIHPEHPQRPGEALRLSPVWGVEVVQAFVNLDPEIGKNARHALSLAFLGGIAQATDRHIDRLMEAAKALQVESTLKARVKAARPAGRLLIQGGGGPGMNWYSTPGRSVARMNGSSRSSGGNVITRSNRPSWAAARPQTPTAASAPARSWMQDSPLQNPAQTYPGNAWQVSAFVTVLRPAPGG